MSGIPMEVTAQSHTGMLRDHNEDNFLVDPKSGLCMVADGMGGHLAGEVASKLCVDTIHARLMGTLQTGGADVEAVRRAVGDAIEAANREIRISAKATQERANMGTTLALLLPCQDQIIVAHVGDSRVYRLRDGHLGPLTKDHSLLQEQVGAGFITNEEARLSHNRNLVTRALGVEDNVEPEIRVEAVRAGDIFLLCSDGLNTMVADADIESVLSSLEANPPLAAKVLVNVANDNGGQDNVTVALAWARQTAGSEAAATAVPVQAAAAAPSPGDERGLISRLFGWLFGK